MADAQEIHTKLKRFLIEEMDRDEHHACIKIELCYMPPGEYARQQLKTWHRVAETDKPYFSGGKSGEVYLDRLTSEMIEIAEYHAESYGTSKHRFRVVSHHAMAGGRHVHNFTILPSFDAATAESETTELTPNGQGLQLQLMRHIENLHRVNKDMMDGFGRAMRDVVQQIREDRESDRQLVRTMEKERFDQLRELEEARSRQHDQQIEAALVTGDVERKAYANKKIFGLLPVAISRYLEGSAEEREGGGGGVKGKDGKPKKWKPSPLSIALGELAESLTEDQEEKLGHLLGMEQKIMLGEAMRVAKKGGNVALPQIVHDLAATFERDQLTRVFALLSPEQQQMFMRAIALAKAEAEPDKPKPQPSSSTSGSSDEPASAPPSSAPNGRAQ